MAKLRSKQTNTFRNTSLSFGPKNYIAFAFGVAIILIGFVFLAQGPANSFSSLTIGPVLLIVGYCVVIPIAILYKDDDSEETKK